MIWSSRKKEPELKKKPDEESSKEINPKKKDVQRLSEKVPNVTNVRPPRASLHEVVTWASGGHLTLVLSRVHLVSSFRYAAKRSCSPTTLLQRQLSTRWKKSRTGVQWKEHRAQENNRFLNPQRRAYLREKQHFWKEWLLRDTPTFTEDKRARQSMIL